MPRSSGQPHDCGPDTGACADRCRPPVCRVVAGFIAREVDRMRGCGRFLVQEHGEVEGVHGDLYGWDTGTVTGIKTPVK